MATKKGLNYKKISLFYLYTILFRNNRLFHLFTEKELRIIMEVI